jgi:hypothetical protein
MWPLAVGETTVRLTEMATALKGIPHLPTRTKLRVLLAKSDGPP